MGSNQFFSYHVISANNCKLDPQSAVVSEAGLEYRGGLGRGQGQMKFSPNGQRLAVANYNRQSYVSRLELFQFDTVTGRVSDLTVPDTSTIGFYGVEFSPDSSALYAVTHSYFTDYLYRYDITGNRLDRRANPIASFRTNVRAMKLGGLQLAPDGRIYLVRALKTFLYVLNAPNAENGGWTRPATTLNLAPGSKNGFGLPSMVAGNFSEGSTMGCCNHVKQTPFWTPDLSLAWKAFKVYNVKYPASDISSIDIDIRDGNGNRPQDAWNAGGLKVNGGPLKVPEWWRSPYMTIPNGTNTQTVIAAPPNFNSPAVNFNLGLDYSSPFTGKVKLTFGHDDGSTCEWLSEDWTPAPPAQLALKVNETYAGNPKGQFLHLVVGFSDGINIERDARWVAVEPIDETEVFSVGVGGKFTDEGTAGSHGLAIASSEKRGNAALYELARPVSLSRLGDGEIKLVLKRPPGNSGKPRLRFIFFDENADLIGFTTNEKQ
jgi:hypothetical protein